jgi:hypothetical protein
MQKYGDTHQKSLNRLIKEKRRRKKEKKKKKPKGGERPKRE